MNTRYVLFAAAAVALTAGVVGRNSRDDRKRPRELWAPVDEPDMPSLGGATAWLNSKPIATTELRGKVILVDFWTYTCINWIRTEPYVRTWASKYSSKGLVVI